MAGFLMSTLGRTAGGSRVNGMNVTPPINGTSASGTVMPVFVCQEGHSSSRSLHGNMDEHHKHITGNCLVHRQNKDAYNGRQ